MNCRNCGPILKEYSRPKANFKRIVSTKWRFSEDKMTRKKSSSAYYSTLWKYTTDNFEGYGAYSILSKVWWRTFVRSIVLLIVLVQSTTIRPRESWQDATWESNKPTIKRGTPYSLCTGEGRFPEAFRLLRRDEPDKHRWFFSAIQNKEVGRLFG